MSSTMNSDETPQPVTGMAREPAMIRAFIVALVGLLVSYGLCLTEDQQSSTIDFITIFSMMILPLIQGWWTRRHVTPTNTVAAQVDENGVTRSGPADGIRPNGAPVSIIPNGENNV